jgi:putative flippase GtrA
MLSGYTLVGAVGFLVDAGVLHFLTAALGIDPIAGRLVSFPVALAVTFLMNRQLVFAGARHPIGLAFIAYAGVQGVGWLVSMAIYAALVVAAPWPLNIPVLALAFASAAALLVNYNGARKIVFHPATPHTRSSLGPFQASWEILRPNAIRLGAIVVLIPIAVFAIYYFISYASLGRNPEAARQNILQAFASGDLKPGAWRDRGNTVTGEHQFNDCLILLMAIDQRMSNPWQLAISPNAPLVDGEQPCDVLRELAETGQTEIGVKQYHRYLHAHTVIARYLLPVMDIPTIRFLFSSALSVLIMAVVAFAMYRLIRGDDIFKGTLFLVTGLCLARWFGIESFSLSLGHAPADAVAVLFVLYLCIMSRRSFSLTHLVATCAVFGTFTMLTEFLTGGLPIGVAMIIGIVPFLLPKTADRIETTVSVAAALAAFFVAAGLCLVIKLSLATFVFGPGIISDFTSSLEHRTTGDLDPVMWVRRVLGGLSVTVGGIHYIMAGLGLVLAVIGGAWGLRRVMRLEDSEIFRIRALFLAGSNLALLGWLVVFWQHTIQHAWFMDRIFVWTYCSGFALFAFGVILDRSGRVRETSSQRMSAASSETRKHDLVDG